MKNPYHTTYYLTVPFTDEVHSVLNGRIFRIKKSDDNIMKVFDALDKTELMTSTTIIDRVDTDDGHVIIKTSSGTVYHLRRLESLLPTAKAVEPAEPAPAPVEFPSPEKIAEATGKPDFEVVETKENFKPIHYGDGYDEVVYTFSRDITEDEFRKFCEDRHMMKEKGAWYENYSTIFGKGNVWTYRWVRVYTD